MSLLCHGLTYKPLGQVSPVHNVHSRQGGLSGGGWLLGDLKGRTGWLCRFAEEERKKIIVTLQVTQSQEYPQYTGAHSDICYIPDIPTYSTLVLETSYRHCIQGFTKEQDEEKIPRVTDEGWNSQKQLSGPVEQKKEEKKRLQDLYLRPKLSPGLVPL